MDWNSLYDKINQAGQFGKGVGEGAYAGGKSLVQGVAALPGLAKRAVVAVGDGVYQTATDPAYREQVFDGVAQLASGTKDFAAAIYRDPIGMTSAGYEAVSAKVKMARDAYGKASAAAEQQGRLPEFLGQIGGRGLFEVGVLFVPISKLSVLGKAGVVLKDGKAVTNLARASEGATLVTDSVKAVKAAEGAETIKPAAAALEASAQYAKREIGIVAKCSEVAPVIVPHGFASAEAFAEFGNSVRTGLGRAGYTDVEPTL